MAIKFRRRIILLHRPLSQIPTNPRFGHPPWPEPRPESESPNLSPGQGQKQAVSGGSVRLVDQAPDGDAAHSVPGILLLFPQLGRPEESLLEAARRQHNRYLRRSSAVPALRGGEDPPMADGADGPEDAVQCVRGPIQVGSARTRVPTRRQPDVCVNEAFELSPESGGAPATKRASTSPPTTAVYSSSTKHDDGCRYIERWG